MRELSVSAERVIDAPAEHVYRCIADYHAHHPHILPPAFSGLRVERGGVGAGTVIAFRMTLMGRGRDFRAEISEPAPGVLVEKDTLSTIVTTFRVVADGARSRTRIESRWQSACGIEGFFERLLAPRVIRRVFDDELRRLEAHARETAPPA